MDTHRLKQALYGDKRQVLNHARLVEPIIRHRVQDLVFYKQHLFLTNEQSILTVIAAQVHYIGGTDAEGRPSPFLCCLVRLLEIDPLQEIIKLYLAQLGHRHFKYLTALALIYVRMVFPAPEAYLLLEAHTADLRRLRARLRLPVFTKAGVPCSYEITYVDVWADDLLHKERVADVLLPRLVPRHVLETQRLVAPRPPETETEKPDSETGDASSDYVSDSD